METKKYGASTSRNPERTRKRLLDAAFQEVYQSGFRGADVDTILTQAGVTKGALYYHFDSKEALGCAVVDEVIAGITRDKWLIPLERGENPIDVLVSVVQATSPKAEDLRYGCPLNNLAQEMSPLDEGFRKRLAKIFGAWHDGIETALRRGQKSGSVRSDVDPDEAATFMIATYEGLISLAKNLQDARVVRSATRSLTHYLESLRPQGKYHRSKSSG